MPMKVPDALELEILTDLFSIQHTLRIYGNNKVPADADVVANYTEIAGGGYANKPLLVANWTLTAGTPSTAVYASQTFIFTGAINAPGTIYGYYVTRNSDGKLMWAERFPALSVPFSPIAAGGSKIVVLPKFNLQSLF